MSQPNDRNQRVIEEFRASGGRSASFGADRPLVLLTTTGRKTGQRRTTPVMYLQDGERLLVFESRGGAPTSPDWYHNLVANPNVTVEVGTETFEAQASVARALSDTNFMRGKPSCTRSLGITRRRPPGRFRWLFWSAKPRLRWAAEASIPA